MKNNKLEKNLERAQKNIYNISFSNSSFSIPPLTSKTTKFLSIPLPPGIKIEMNMDRLQGKINDLSGEIILDFESRFVLSICSLYSFPNLLIKTSLTTGTVKGKLHEEKGFISKRNGKLRLVGISIVPITGNKILDNFLNLPNEALAVLQCKIH